MLVYVDLTNWKKKKEILSELRMSGIVVDERTWRMKVEENNKMYWEYKSEAFIVHGSKGYKESTDPKEIIASLDDNYKRALNLLWKRSQTLKRLRVEDNLRLDLETMDII